MQCAIIFTCMNHSSWFSSTLEHHRYSSRFLWDVCLTVPISLIAFTFKLNANWIKPMGKGPPDILIRNSPDTAAEAIVIPSLCRQCSALLSSPPPPLLLIKSPAFLSLCINSSPITRCFSHKVFIYSQWLNFLEYTLRQQNILHPIHLYLHITHTTNIPKD